MLNIFSTILLIFAATMVAREIIKILLVTFLIVDDGRD